MIIVTKKLTGGSTATSGGVYTQNEKLNIELEMAYKAAQVSNYKELLYDGNGNLSTLNVYTESGGTLLFTKTLLYDSVTLDLSASVLERISDSALLTKTLEYVDGNLTNITQVKT